MYIYASKNKIYGASYTKKKRYMVPPLIKISGSVTGHISSMSE